MKQSEVPVAETGLALPPDMVEEILLRVPARQLRRFCAVCRSWRSLLTDPSFVKAHAALHPALILALAADDDRIDVVDFSGNIVKQIPVPAAEEAAPPPARPGPCFLFRASNRVRMVDPDTGTIFTLPFDDLDDPAFLPSSWFTRTDYVLGRDASAGHHKVLRIVTRRVAHATSCSPFGQLCHVLSLGDDDGDIDNRQGRHWRHAPRPPMFVSSNVDLHGVTIRGSVFFLAGDVFNTYDYDISCQCNHRMYNVKTDRIASFDLEKERWRPATLGGPPEISTASAGARRRRMLAELNDTLVMMVYCDLDHTDMDFWFAEDLEKGLWVKKHSVQRELLEPCPYMWLQKDIKQVMELDNGRIVFSYYVSWTVEEPHWRTRVYDPRTKTYTDLPQLDGRSTVGVYIKSLPC